MKTLVRLSLADSERERLGVNMGEEMAAALAQQRGNKGKRALSAGEASGANKRQKV
jgi:hypothetical protein